MKKLLPLVSSLFCATAIYAQDPSILWQKNYGSSVDDYLYDIKITSDGGFIGGGRVSNSDDDVAGCGFHGAADAWVIKMDALGNTEWKKCYGGTAGDVAKSVIETEDGGYAFVGYTSSSGPAFPDFHNLTDIWLVKLDHLGNLQWQKTFGGSGEDYSSALIQTFDKGYLITAYTASADFDVSGQHGPDDLWLVKTDSMGNPLWKKCLGGSNEDFGFDAKQLPDSGFVIVGETGSNNGDITSSHGSMDVWVLRLDKSGNVVWKKTFGGSGDENARKIVLLADGNYVLAGSTSSTNGDFIGVTLQGGSDVLLMKISPMGDLIWFKTYGSSNYENTFGLYSCTDNGFFIGSWAQGNDGDIPHNYGLYDVFLVKTDAAGNLTWSKDLGGSGDDRCTTVLQTSDNGYVVGAYAKSADMDVAANHGGYDYWIFKLDQNTGIAENKAVNHTVSIYPNPTTGNFQIEGVKPGSVVNIFDPAGQLVHSAAIQTTQQKLNVRLARGLYLCVLTEGGKVTGQGKLVVE